MLIVSRQQPSVGKQKHGHHTQRSHGLIGYVTSWRTCGRLDVDFHAKRPSEHQTQGGPRLDIVVSESMVILEHCGSQHQALLAGGDVLLGLDLALDREDHIGPFYI